MVAIFESHILERNPLMFLKGSLLEKNDFWGIFANHMVPSLFSSAAVEGPNSKTILVLNTSTWRWLFSLTMPNANCGVLTGHLRFCKTIA